VDGKKYLRESSIPRPRGKRAPPGPAGAGIRRQTPPLPARRSNKTYSCASAETLSRPNCAPRGGRPRRCPAAGGLWRASTMRLNWLRGGVLLAAMGLAGCSSHAPEPPPVVQEEPGLPEKAEANLAGWLNLPRAELAKLADDWKETVDRLQEK